MSEHRQVRIPYPKAKRGYCCWCARPITQGRADRRWHDGRDDERDCKGEYHIATSYRAAIGALRKTGIPYACAECGSTTCMLEVDHKKPLANGGGFDLKNLQLLCGPARFCRCGRKCHQVKTAQEARERAKRRRAAKRWAQSYNQESLSI